MLRSSTVSDRTWFVINHESGVVPLDEELEYMCEACVDSIRRTGYAVCFCVRLPPTEVWT